MKGLGPHPFPSPRGEGRPKNEDRVRENKKSPPGFRMASFKIVKPQFLLLPAQHHEVIHGDFRDVALLALIRFVIAVHEFALYGNLLPFL
jgi:hypothetical protein